MYFVTNGFPFACYNVRSYFVTKSARLIWIKKSRLLSGFVSQLSIIVYLC